MAKLTIEIEASNAQVAFIAKVLAGAKRNPREIEEEREQPKRKYQRRIKVSTPRWSYYSRRKLARTMRKVWERKRAEQQQTAA